MKDAETQYLNNLVRDIFNNIGDFRFQQSRSAGQAQDALRGYVTSDHFKAEFINQHLYPEHIAEVEDGAELTLDGSFEFRLEDAGEVQQYVTEIEAFAGVYKDSQLLRQYMQRRFTSGRLLTIFDTMLREQLSLEGAMGYDFLAAYTSKSAPCKGE